MKFVPSLFAVSLAAMSAFAAPLEERGPSDKAPSKNPFEGLTIEGLIRHTDKFQSFADANDNNRAFGSPGHNATLEYFVDQTKDYYDVTVQPTVFGFSKPVKQTASLVGVAAQSELKVKLMTKTNNTPEEGIEAEVAVVDGLGCKAEDFGDNVKGKIALVQRGECEFGAKATAAGKAGAVAVLIYNNEEGEVSGRLGTDHVKESAPAAGITKQDGERLIKQVQEEGKLSIKLSLVEFSEDRSTANVCAQTKSGDASNVIVVGAHSDSVPEGPGINDNGSGSAALLELAHLFKDQKPKNAVRFCWWTAEEAGLLGSTYYVENLSEEERKKIALYLNFDMIASPNAMNGIYSPSSSPGSNVPAGSNAIEKLLVDYFKENHGYSTPTEFDGRSDYGPFIEVDIPAGGTFTGAEGIMTDEEAEQYGGKAGQAYDECYHASCDTKDNLNEKYFLLHAQAIGHAIATYSESTKDVDDEKAAAAKKIVQNIALPASTDASASPNAGVKPVSAACGSELYDM